MADDDQSDFGPVYQSGQEALDAPPTPAYSPGETAPPVTDEGSTDEGEGTGDTRPYTPQEKMQKSFNANKEARDRLDKLESTTRPMWEKYRSMLQQDQQSREQMDQQMINSLQQNQQQMPQQKKNDFWSAFGTMMAVVVPIALAFGLRGNGFAKGAMLSGLGAAIKNFTEGRDKAAKEDMKAFNEQAKAIKESNTERNAIYKDILADRKMELDDQFKMIHSVAQQFWDPYMSKASGAKNMAGVQKQLNNQDKVNKRFKEGVDHVNKKVRPKNWADYAQYMKDKYHVDVDQDPQKADAIKTYTDWEEEHHPSKAEAEEKKSEADPDAPLNDDEAAKIRSKVLD